MLRFLDAGVFENPIQESGAYIFFRVYGDRDDMFRRRIPELTMATLAGAKFFETVPLQQANELGPCHNAIIEPNVGLCQVSLPGETGVHRGAESCRRPSARRPSRPSGPARRDSDMNIAARRQEQRVFTRRNAEESQDALGRLHVGEGVMPITTMRWRQDQLGPGHADPRKWPRNIGSGRRRWRR